MRATATCAVGILRLIGTDGSSFRLRFYFKPERRHAPLAILGVPAEELAREGVHTRGSLAGPDGPENGRAGIGVPLRDHEPSLGVIGTVLGGRVE